MNIRMYDNRNLKYALDLNVSNEVTLYYPYDERKTSLVKYELYKRVADAQNYCIVHSEEEFTFELWEQHGGGTTDEYGTITWDVEPPVIPGRTVLTCTYTVGETGLELGYGQCRQSGPTTYEYVFDPSLRDVKITVFIRRLFRGRHFIIPLINITSGQEEDTYLYLIDNNKPVNVIWGTEQ
jgi:hypothetical protein